MAADSVFRGYGDYAFVGSFTSKERQARGQGITVFRVGPAKVWEPTSVLAGILNPSYLLFDQEKDVLFAAHGDGDFASSYAFDRRTGNLRPLGTARTSALNGVSLALDPSRRFLFVANYSSGSISTLPVAADGMLKDATYVLKLAGPLGPHRVEQSMSHPHHTVIDPSGHFLIVCEKGLDRVFVIAADTGGRLTVRSEAAMRPGAGPRHIAFHPTLPRAFVVNEIDSTVTTLAWDAASGALTPLHVVQTLPPTFFAQNTAGEILVGPDRRSVYISHRGADLIAHCTLSDSGLKVVDWVSAGGRTPRFMAVSPTGDMLFVTNEQSDLIAGFTIDMANGRLNHTMEIPTPSPAVVVFS